MSDAVRAIVTGLRSRVRRSLGDRQLSDEVATHLDLLAAEYRARGLTEKDARAAARRDFGPTLTVTEACRESRGLSGLDALWQDVRFTVRLIVRAPGFALTSIGTLSLGIGAATVVFSWMSAMLSASAPIQDMERLVGVWSDNRASGEAKTVVSMSDFDEWRRRQQWFERLDAQRMVSFNLSGADQPVRIAGARVTAGYFPMYSADPVLGRAFTTADQAPGAPLVVVVGDRLWRDHFAASHEVIGRELRLDGVRATIVGVLPRNDYTPEVLVPLVVDSRDPAYQERNLFVSGRLKPMMSVGEAAAGMRTLGQQLEQEQPETRRGWGVNVRPLQEEFVGSQARLVFTMLAAAAGAVLLIGCANIANLLLVRGAERNRELAIRAAIGASRRRLIGQMLAEGSVLALLGGVGGVFVAQWGLQLLRTLMGSGQPYVDRAVVDIRVLGFAALAAGVSTLLCALGPAIRSARPHAASLSQQQTAAPTFRRVRGALVAGEVAAAMLLLILAVLFLRTLTAFAAVPPGFDPTHLLTVRLSLPAPRYVSQSDVRRFYADVDRQLARIPGVTDVGATLRLPAAGDRFNPNRTLRIEGRTAAPNETWFANDLTVTPGYLAAMRIPVLAGRALEATDDDRAPLVVVVSAAAARRYWPSGSALGAHLRLGDEPSATGWRTVVGVVGDIRNDDVDQPPSPQVYVPHAQRPTRDLTVVLRTSGAPETYAAAARTVLARLDPDTPMYDVRTMEEVLAQDLRPTAVLVGMATLFAVVATALAALGIYGVVARGVTQMRRDLGIRLALGASVRGVVALVLRQGLTPVFVGAAAGVALGAVFARLLRSVLYGVTPGEVSTYLVACLVLVVSAVFACLVPALRAARINPLSALRCD